MLQDIRDNLVSETVSALAPLLQDSCCCQEEEYHEGVGLSISLKSSQDNGVINNATVSASLLTEVGLNPRFYVGELNLALNTTFHLYQSK